MSYHIEMDSYRRIGWITLVVWIAAAIGAFYGSQPRAGAVLIAFGLLPAYILLDAGSYDLDDEGVTRRSVFGVWRIRWDEITRVEVGETDGTVLLLGHDKQFYLSPPGFWPQPLRDEGMAYLVAQLDRHHVPPPTFRRSAAYKTMKNTRVR